jgi:hypothetical protein
VQDLPKGIHGKKFQLAMNLSQLLSRFRNRMVLNR